MFSLIREVEVHYKYITSLKYVSPIFLILIILILSRCSNENIPVVTEEVKPPVSIIGINPVRSWVGQNSKVYFHNNIDSLIVLDYASFNGYELYLDSLKGDTIYFRRPYFTTYINSFLHFYDLQNDSIINVKMELNPYPEICTDSVCVMWNNIDTVTEYLVYRNNWWYNWETTITADTIELEINVNIPNEVWFRKLKFIDKGINNLPEFISYIEEGWLQAVYYDTLKTGLIKIDSWDREGIVSGGIFTNDWSRRSEYLVRFFWADLSN